MINGCGIDTEEFIRFNKHLKNFKGSHFARFVLSDAEIDNFLKYSPEQCFPIAFCCKEAFFKALGSGWMNSPIDWKDIEIFFTDAPEHKTFRIELGGHALLLSKQLKISEIRSNYEIFDDHVTFEVILHNES